MHLGNLLSEVIYARNMNMEDAAAYMELSIQEVQKLIQKEDWLGSEIKLASARLNYDFSKHVSPWSEDFSSFYGKYETAYYIAYVKETDGDKLDELNITIRQKCMELGLECV